MSNNELLLQISQLLDAKLQPIQAHLEKRIEQVESNAEYRILLSGYLQPLYFRGGKSPCFRNGCGYFEKGCARAQRKTEKHIMEPNSGSFLIPQKMGISMAKCLFFMALIVLSCGNTRQTQ